MTDAEKKLIESTFGTNHDLEVDEVKISHMVQYGYPKDYITKCLQENLPNYTTAGYYLLRMDQTYTTWTIQNHNNVKLQFCILNESKLTKK